MSSQIINNSTSNNSNSNSTLVKNNNVEHLLPAVSEQYKLTTKHNPFMLYPGEQIKQYHHTYKDREYLLSVTNYGRVYNHNTQRFIKSVPNINTRTIANRLFTREELDNDYYKHNMPIKHSNYYANHREERRQYQANYYEQHKDVLNAKRVEYYYKQRQLAQQAQQEVKQLRAQLGRSLHSLPATLNDNNNN